MTQEHSVLNTKSTILANCRYGYWLASFQHKFYGRANSVCNFMQVLLGAAMATSALQNLSAAWLAGLGVAVVGALQLVIPFGENAEKAYAAMKKFHSLESQIDAISVDAASAQLAAIQQEGVPSWAGMEVLAVNRVCDWHNAPAEKMRLMLSSRFFSLFL